MSKGKESGAESDDDWLIQEFCALVVNEAIAKMGPKFLINLQAQISQTVTQTLAISEKKIDTVTKQMEGIDQRLIDSVEAVDLLRAKVNSGVTQQESAIIEFRELLNRVELLVTTPPTQGKLLASNAALNVCMTENFKKLTAALKDSKQVENLALSLNQQQAIPPNTEANSNEGDAFQQAAPEQEQAARTQDMEEGVRFRILNWIRKILYSATPRLLPATMAQIFAMCLALMLASFFGAKLGVSAATPSAVDKPPPTAVPVQVPPPTLSLKKNTKRNDIEIINDLLANNGELSSCGGKLRPLSECLFQETNGIKDKYSIDDIKSIIGLIFLLGEIKNKNTHQETVVALIQISANANIGEPKVKVDGKLGENDFLRAISILTKSGNNCKKIQEAADDLPPMPARYNLDELAKLVLTAC